MPEIPPDPTAASSPQPSLPPTLPTPTQAEAPPQPGGNGNTSNAKKGCLLIGGIYMAVCFLAVLAVGALMAMGFNVDPGKDPLGIDQVILSHSTSMGVGGYMYTSYDPIILFKDGTATSDAKVADLDFDKAASQKDKPKRWGKWKQSGKSVIITWGGGKKQEEIKKPNYAEPAAKYLERTYNAVGGGGNTAFGGTTTVFWSRSYTFTKDGRYDTGSSAGGITQGDGWGGGSGGVTTHAKRSDRGTYQIEGYTLELEAEDGTKSRRLLYLYSKEANVIGIGGSAYISSKKDRKK